jgi:DNA-binding NarL/FixJ family response regulator
VTPARTPRLTPREEAIARAILAAQPNKAIADELGISEQSVKNRLTKLYRKFGVTSRLQLMRVLIKHPPATE